jgi:hypothetical protein
VTTRRLTALLTVSGMIWLALAYAATPGVAKVPARNGQIVFGDEGSEHIFTVNPDGTHQQQLIPGKADCPAWSPDGAKVVVCTRSPEKLFRPATVNADGSGFKILDNPDPALNLFCTSWSPDGARLVCEGGTDPPSNRDGLYTVRSSDGGGLQRVTKNPFGLFSCCPPRAQDAVPDYSPDGSRITFTRTNQKAQSAIFTVNVDGTDERQVTPWGLGAAWSRWSPDGNWIVFAHKDWYTDPTWKYNPSWLSHGDLYLVHPDGTGLHKIAIDTNGSHYFAKTPTWSPDGTLILFVMYVAYNHEGQPDMFTMHPDGSHVRQVTDTQITDNAPDWGTHPPVT